MHTFDAVKIFREFIIVKVPSVFIDETGYKGVDGKQIIVNVFHRPERHVRNYGIVTSVPDELLHQPIASDHIGAPNYVDYPVYSWKTGADIELDIRVGDKAYFHHNSLLPDMNGGGLWNIMHLLSRKEDGVYWHYFRVRYSQVFAAVRYEPLSNAVAPWDWSKEGELKAMTVRSGDDKRNEELFVYTDKQGFDHTYRKRVVMIGSYVFIRPDMETWEEISIPIPETINGKVLLGPDGKPKMKPKEQWLVCKKEPEARYLQGWVIHTGNPLRGDKEFLRQGMYVYFQRDADTVIKFEGNEYYRLRQRHVFGIAPIKQLEYDTV